MRFNLSFEEQKYCIVAGISIFNNFDLLKFHVDLTIAIKCMINSLRITENKKSGNNTDVKISNGPNLFHGICPKLFSDRHLPI